MFACYVVSELCKQLQFGKDEYHFSMSYKFSRLRYVVMRYWHEKYGHIFVNNIRGVGNMNRRKGKGKKRKRAKCVESGCPSMIHEWIRNDPCMCVCVCVAFGSYGDNATDRYHKVGIDGKILWKNGSEIFRRHVTWQTCEDPSGALIWCLTLEAHYVN